jgi:hypothetical protein
MVVYKYSYTYTAALLCNVCIAACHRARGGGGSGGGSGSGSGYSMGCVTSVAPVAVCLALIVLITPDRMPFAFMPAGCIGGGALYKLNAVDPWLESASGFNHDAYEGKNRPVSKFAFKIQLVYGVHLRVGANWTHHAFAVYSLACAVYVLDPRLLLRGLRSLRRLRGGVCAESLDEEPPPVEVFEVSLRDATSGSGGGGGSGVLAGGLDFEEAEKQQGGLTTKPARGRGARGGRLVRQPRGDERERSGTRRRRSAGHRGRRGRCFRWRW